MFRAYGLKTQDAKKSDKASLNTDTVDQTLSIEERITEYLDTQGCVLWGQFFDIQSKEGRRQASEFILDILIDLQLTNELVE